MSNNDDLLLRGMIDSSPCERDRERERELTDLVASGKRSVWPSRNGQKAAFPNSSGPLIVLSPIPQSKFSNLEQQQSDGTSNTGSTLEVP